MVLPVGPEVGPTSPFCSYIPTGTHGQTCIVWANLTPFLLQAEAPQLAAERQLGGATPVPVGAPAAPANIFETLWTAAPLKAGAAKGTVEVDLSSLSAAGRTTVCGVRST
jgi:hypothetical protein